MLYQFSCILQTMETLPVKRLKVSERLCPHCNQVLSFKTFQAHKRIYYNAVTGDWIEKGVQSNNLDRDDDTESTNTDSSPPSETEMDQYPTIESPPLVDSSLPTDNCDHGMLFVHGINDNMMSKMVSP